MNEPLCSKCDRVTACVDLRELARVRRWRWRFEESYQAERDPETRGDGRWYVEILCHRGLIYPWGEQDLLVYTATRGVKELLLALDPAVRMHQHGDTEAVVRFPEALLDRVAEIMRPRTSGSRTPPSAEARARGLRAIAERRANHVIKAPESPSGGTIRGQCA
jgi:hypothetical protein